ncbi:hypothetical protein [Phenylobacterium sp.]|uniref:hypothetical protein n=1 Tax=Phenylobacterium sp. TaxID=1871053 RepID=UPI002CF37E76|nr:hypothetical protein [Phenylobacterium sp.]HLZ76846.1 hypothetical protein [Phenylobacterium sp.]
MTSLSRTLALAGAVALAASAPVHAKSHGKGRIMADGYSRPAEEVLAQARKASGGAGWNLLRGIHVTGHEKAASGDIRFETWVDPLRYGMRTETRQAAGVLTEGFNGQGDWRILPDGKTVAIDDHAAVDKLRTEAFLAAGGIFYTSRFEAHGELIGVRTSGGKSFDVLNVEPWGGAPRELWFDRSTHLLARVVDRTGPQAVTTELSDYRRVGPVRIAFHTVVRGPSPGAIQDRQLDSVVFTPADRSLFSLPRTETPAAP